jgi:RNA polymerase sigma-70 factor (ECF subfamily)
VSESVSESEELVALMRAYQAGRIEAFERLYSLVAPGLRRYFASRRVQASPDLVQETFLEIHRSRHTYRAPLPVAPWIFGVARNVERRYWRRQKRHEARNLELFDSRAGISATGVARGVEWCELEEAVGLLPPSGRVAWLMHHVQGLSFSEVAVRLSIEAGAARLRAHRAMTALRRLLGIGRRERER